MTPPARGKIWMSASEKRASVARIKQGGIIADKIREAEKEHHEQEEVPEAERKFAADLALAYAVKKPEIKREEEYVSQNYWELLCTFWRKIWGLGKNKN
ncbi:MAG: hypothetical protein WCJ84_01830 [Candidatus Peregrinibacteria bacterium]